VQQQQAGAFNNRKKKKCIRIRDLTYKKTLRVGKHTAHRTEKKNTLQNTTNQNFLPIYLTTLRKHNVYWKQDTLVPNSQT
jgi:hypothetical protein